MTSSMFEKLYEIAEYLGDLNSMGKVKGNPYHEKGYAKIQQVKRGCSFWIHYWNDERLLIDLLISETAKNRFPADSEQEVNLFRKLFGENVERTTWSHSDGRGKEHDHYYINVGSASVDEIKTIITQIQNSFT